MASSRRPKNLAQGKVDISNLVTVLNEKAPGAGNQLSQAINHIGSRLTAQAGHRGSVAIAKQTKVHSSGRLVAALDLNDQRMTGLADPHVGTDIVNLNFFRRHETCDAFAERFFECLELKPVIAATGPSEWAFSLAEILEIYIYENSAFALCRNLRKLGVGQPTHNLAVMEIPALVPGAPIVLRGTYDPVTNPVNGSPAIAGQTFMPDEANGFIYGTAAVGILGGFGRLRVRTNLNTVRISDVDSLALVESHLVEFVDGPPGADGVTLGGLSGAQAYSNGKIIGFQSGNGSIYANDPTHRLYFFTGSIPPAVTGVHVFDGYTNDSPVLGTVNSCAIADDVAYVIYDRGGDFNTAGTSYELISLDVSSGAGQPPMIDRQTIDIDVPNSSGLGTTNWIRAVGSPISKLHVLHSKYRNPNVNPRVDFFWKIYDISNAGVPVLQSNLKSPCNQWIGMHVQDNCVMLVEVFDGVTPPHTATLWDATDGTNPRLIGGCNQTEVPGFQQFLNNFLRDSRGYYVTPTRFVIQDFEGHGIHC